MVTFHMKICFTTLFVTLRLVLEAVTMNDNQFFIVEQNIFEFFIILIYLYELNKKRNLQKIWRYDQGLNPDHLLSSQAL